VLLALTQLPILPDLLIKRFKPPSGGFFLWHPMASVLLATMDENKKVKQQLRIAEIVNGRAAMLGFVAAIGAYLATGQILPGVF